MKSGDRCRPKRKCDDSDGGCRSEWQIGLTGQHVNLFAFRPAGFVQDALVRNNSSACDSHVPSPARKLSRRPKGEVHVDRFVWKLEGSGLRADEDPSVQKCMNVRMDSLHVATDTPRDLSQSERPGAGHRLQNPPAVGSENSPHERVRGKGQSRPALGAPRKRAREPFLHALFRSDPDCHSSHCYPFHRATSAQKSACILSSDVNA